MAPSRSRNINVRLLACLIDAEDVDISDYRFLVEEKHVKYVTTAPGTFPGSEDRTFESILLGELFPPFPPGKWNQGDLAKDPLTGEVAFVTMELVDLPGIKSIRHPVKLSALDSRLKTI
jgi:hypothetical protein